MRDNFFSKFGFVLVVLVAFIDGILVADHFNNKLDSTKATTGVEIEDIFAMYETEPEAEPIVEEPAYEVIREVSFTSQAPRGDWKSPWSDYAEEAVMAMVLQWWKDEPIQSAAQAELIMEDIARFESEYFGDSLLASLEQVQTVLRDLFGISSTFLDQPTAEDLIQVVEAGGVIVAPVNGQILLNPHYGDPAPEHHMILIHGWSEAGFAAHDPGTRHGEDTIYSQEKILESIQDLDGQLRVLIISL